MADRSKHTPTRNVRIGDDDWKAAQEVARERGETLSDVIREALVRYVKRHRRS